MLNLAVHNSERLIRGGVLIRGLRAIGAHVGVSAMTILRWHKAFRGAQESPLCFPLMILPSGRGWGWVYVAHSCLIKEWVRRWCAIDATGHPSRPKRATNAEALRQLGRMGFTGDMVASKGESATPVRESSGKSLNPTCTCGSATPCLACG